MSDDIHYGDIFVITWDDLLASRARLATQFGTSDGDGPPILVDDWKPPRRPPTHSPGRLQHSGWTTPNGTKVVSDKPGR